MIVAFFLSLALLFAPGDVGSSSFYCKDAASARKIVDLAFPKTIPDNLPCFFALPDFSFIVDGVVENYKSVYIVEVSNPFDRSEKRFVLQFIKGEDA